MTIDEFLLQVRERRLILINEREIWPSPAVSPAIQRALRRHRRGLRLLLTWSPISTCPARDLHRKEFYYHEGLWICGACERLLKEVA
jgi:hypothetical protein